jgi:hypothetical protein
MRITSVPESTLDRLVLVLGVCALAGLVALIVPAWRDYATADDPSRAGSARRSAAQSTTDAARHAEMTPLSVPTATIATTPPSNAPATASSPPRRPAQPRVAKLTLVAAKGDCWIEAHSDSVSGRLLYAGILGQGKKLTVSGRVLWLRLGAPQNLVGWISAKPVRNLPRGAATIVATPTGLRTLELG